MDGMDFMDGLDTMDTRPKPPAWTNQEMVFPAKTHLYYLFCFSLCLGGFVSKHLHFG
jgi:hypothetical protein